MNTETFAAIAAQAVTDADTARKMRLVYGREIPSSVLALCTSEPKGVFFEGVFCRKMDIDEILDSKDFWQVDFPTLGLLPIFDCGDNDFIVCRLSDGKWLKFNIVDEIAYRESDDWQTLI